MRHLLVLLAVAFIISPAFAQRYDDQGHWSNRGHDLDRYSQGGGYQHERYRQTEHQRYGGEDNVNAGASYSRQLRQDDLFPQDRRRGYDHDARQWSQRVEPPHAVAGRVVHVIAIVQTDDGRNVPVLLGHANAVAVQGQTLSLGDRVRVHGAWQQVNHGPPAVVASAMRHEEEPDYRWEESMNDRRRGWSDRSWGQNTLGSADDPEYREFDSRSDNAYDTQYETPVYGNVETDWRHQELRSYAQPWQRSYVDNRREEDSGAQRWQSGGAAYADREREAWTHDRSSLYAAPNYEEERYEAYDDRGQDPQSIQRMYRGAHQLDAPRPRRPYDRFPNSDQQQWRDRLNKSDADDAPRYRQW